MLNWILNLASTHADKIGNVIGMPASDIRGAIEQGKKLLPNINNMDDGIRTFKRLGMSPEFVDGIYNKYSHYAHRIPGLDKNALDGYYSAIKRGLSDDMPSNQTKRNTATSSANNKFNKEKYRKI